VASIEKYKHKNILRNRVSVILVFEQLRGTEKQSSWSLFGNAAVLAMVKGLMMAVLPCFDSPCFDNLIRSGEVKTEGIQ
jgi:hypothetical protein